MDMDNLEWGFLVTRLVSNWCDKSYKVPGEHIQVKIRVKNDIGVKWGQFFHSSKITIFLKFFGHEICIFIIEKLAIFGQTLRFFIILMVIS